MRPLIPNLLNTVQLLDARVKSLVSDKSPIDCPICGQKLFLRPRAHPNFFVCPACRRAFDSVSLYDAATQTNDLVTSIKKIVQNNGLIGKVNNSNMRTALDITCEPQQGYNKLVDFSNDQLSSGEWVEGFSDLLTSLDLYFGTQPQNVETIQQVMQLWTESALARSEINLNSSATYPDRNLGTSSGKKSVVVPAWTASGIAGMWMLGTSTVYHHTYKLDKTGGLAFINDTEDYKSVLATQDLHMALKIHCIYYTKFKRHAPVIVYNPNTIAEDWNLLGGRNVVFCDVGRRRAMDKTVLQPALDYEFGCITNLSISQALDDTSTFSKLSMLIESGKPAFYFIRRHKEIKENPIFKQLDLGRFLAHATETYGLDNVNKLGIGHAMPARKTITYGGNVIEETADGYRLITRDDNEIITNFTVSLKKLHRLKDVDELIYQGELSMDGAYIPIEFDNMAIVGANPKIEGLFQKAAVDAGLKAVPFVSYLWSKRLADIVRMFNPGTEAQIVCEEIRWDEATKVFLLPGYTMSARGAENIQSVNLREDLPLQYTDRVVQSTMRSFYKLIPKAISEIITYIVYGLLAQMDSNLEMKPLMMVRKRKRNYLLMTLLRSGIECVPYVYHRQCSHEAKDSLDNSLAIVETDHQTVMEMGTLNKAWILGDQLDTMTTSKTTIPVFDGLVRSTLKHILLHRVDINCYEDVRNLFYELLGKEDAEAARTCLLTPAECGEQYLKDGGELSQFVIANLGLATDEEDEEEAKTA